MPLHGTSARGYGRVRLRRAVRFQGGTVSREGRVDAHVQQGAQLLRGAG